MVVFIGVLYDPGVLPWTRTASSILHRAAKPGLERTLGLMKPCEQNAEGLSIFLLFFFFDF